MTAHLTCREFIDFLLAYLEGELEPSRRALFERHLAACDDCADYLESYRSTIELERDAFLACGPADPVPDEVPEDLVRAVLAARRGG